MCRGKVCVCGYHSDKGEGKESYKLSLRRLQCVCVCVLAHNQLQSITAHGSEVIFLELPCTASLLMNCTLQRLE